MKYDVGYLCHHYYVVKSVLFLDFIENVPLHILLFYARMIHLLFKIRPLSIETMLYQSLNISCIYLTNLPYFNSTSTQELCHSQHMLLNCVAIYLSSISVGWHDHNRSSWFERHTNKTRDWPFWVHLLSMGMCQNYIY